MQRTTKVCSIIKHLHGNMLTLDFPLVPSGQLVIWEHLHLSNMVITMLGVRLKLKTQQIIPGKAIASILEMMRMSIPNITQPTIR